MKRANQANHLPSSQSWVGSIADGIAENIPILCVMVLLACGDSDPTVLVAIAAVFFLIYLMLRATAAIARFFRS